MSNEIKALIARMATETDPTVINALAAAIQAIASISQAPRLKSVEAEAQAPVPVRREPRYVDHRAHAPMERSVFSDHGRLWANSPSPGVSNNLRCLHCGAIHITEGRLNSRHGGEFLIVCDCQESRAAYERHVHDLEVDARRVSASRVLEADRERRSKKITGGLSTGSARLFALDQGSMTAYHQVAMQARRSLKADGNDNPTLQEEACAWTDASRRDRERTLEEFKDRELRYGDR